jgi:hypothetical protein
LLKIDKPKRLTLEFARPQDSRADCYCWIAWTVWLVFCLGHVIVDGVLQYPSNFDSLTYHLPTVSEWCRTSTFYGRGLAKWFFPANNEMIAFWCVAPFSGDFLAALNNAPGLVLLVLSMVQLSRLLGTSSTVAHFAAAVTVTNQIVWSQVIDNKNDIAVAAFFVSSLGYGFRYSTQGKWSNAICAGIAVGLLVGTKYYAIGYAASSTIATIGAAWFLRSRKHGIRILLACGLGTFLLGGFWYARNWIMTGRPLFPSRFLLKPTDERITTGYFFGTTLLGSSFREKWPLFVQALWNNYGPCQVAAFIVFFLGVCYLLVTGLQWSGNSRRHNEGTLRCILAGIGIWTFLIYALTPFTVGNQINAGAFLLTGGYVSARLGFTFMCVVALCAALVISDWPRMWRRVTRGSGAFKLATRRVFLKAQTLAVIAGVCGLLYQVVVLNLLSEHAGGSVAQLRPLLSMIVADIILVVGFVVAVLMRQLGLTYRIAFVVFPLIFGVVACCTGALGARWHAGFAGYYDKLFFTTAFSFCEREIPEGERVCVLARRSYPFGGSRRQNAVSQAINIPCWPNRFMTWNDVFHCVDTNEARIVVAESDSRRFEGINIDQLDLLNLGLVRFMFEDDVFVVGYLVGAPTVSQ